ncbi:MAG: alpha/beta fold hydrolase [Anaerolineae bacterium]
MVTLAGLVLALAAILVPHLLDRKLWNRTPVTFSDPAADLLAGSYHPGEIEAGLLLLEGFGSDQVTMRSLASEFSWAGYHVFTFDFSGHGRSPGTLGYDNAETPRLAHQALVARDKFKALSGLKDEQILLLGHSLGARVALQAASIDPSPAGLILLGTQVNLSRNAQSEFFTGVSDAELAWVQALGPETPATNLLLISGQWDDILTPAAAQRLAEKLSGGPLAPNSGTGDLAAGSRRDLMLFPRLVHNYEVFSPRALAAAKVWAARALGLSAPPAGAPTAAVRIACWILGLAGLLAALIGADGWRKAGRAASSRLDAVPPAREMNVQITNLRRFLIAKLLLWLAALPLGALLAGAFFFLPVGLPTFNLIYVAFFGGYGIMMYLLYRFGRMPGTQGRLPFLDGQTGDRRGVLAALAVTTLLLVLTAAYARTGWFFVYPLNMRLLWLVLFSLPTALGFWIGIYEMGMIARVAPGSVAAQAGALLIGILPFFLYAALLAGLGSISGMLAAVQGLLILGLVLAAGHLLRQLSRVHWVTALCQAVLLYWLILPQGVLFR